MFIIGPWWQVLLFSGIVAIPTWVWCVIILGLLDMMGLYMITPYVLALSIGIEGYIIGFKMKPIDEKESERRCERSYKLSVWILIIMCTIMTFYYSNSVAMEKEGLGTFLASVEEAMIVSPMIILPPILITLCKKESKIREQYAKPVSERKPFYRVSRPIGVALAIIFIALAIYIFKNPEGFQEFVWKFV